jgi:hypothetical protein
MDVANGVVAGALKVDFTRSFYDSKQCIAFTELVAATDPNPHVTRDMREVIQAAADAYLDNWGNPEIKVSHGTLLTPSPARDLR